MALQNVNLKGKKPTGDEDMLPIDGVAWSTNIPLSANEEKSTGWIKINSYKSLQYIVQADQSGVIQALEYSTDGVNVSAGGTSRTYDEPGKLLQTFVALKDNYFRVRYKNGPVAQNSFFFACQLSTTVGQNTMNSIFLPVTPTNVASITKSVIELNDGSDIYGQVHRTGNSINVHVDNIEATDVSLLAKEATLKDGSAKVQVTNFPATQPISGSVNVLNLPATQPISAASLPLPGGASTSSLQTTANNSLASIDSKLTSPIHAIIDSGQLNVAVVSNETRDFIHQQTILGNVYTWGSGKVSGLVAATNIRAYINNPSGSGKTLTIFALILDNGSATPQFAQLIANPTTNLPTTSKGTGTNMNMSFGSVPSPFTAYADTGVAMSGGSNLPEAFAPGNMRTEFLEDQQVFVVPPGGKIGVNFPILGVANSFQVVIYGIVT